MKIARCLVEGRTFWALVDPTAELIREFRGDFAIWAPELTSDFDQDRLDLLGEHPLAGVHFVPPIEPTSKIVIAGANYTRHLEEFGIAPPGRPFAFLKAYNALIGASDPIRYPEQTSQLDYEVELVAVVGSIAIDRDDPFRSVLGYTVGNDVSARDVQRAGPAGIGMDLYGAKSQFQTTGLGPWIVTRDELAAGQPDLRMTLLVNGETRQDGRTSDMTWDVGQLLAAIDANVRFDCGDILFTGTPEGVAEGSGRFLQVRDLVEAEIERIGKLSNRVT
jgi:2-keto-4-pentenoate hydratase/2-oxohepta-3-ene-1,7-dioic acid hydratase in catechol pathway